MAPLRFRSSSALLGLSLALPLAACESSSEPAKVRAARVHPDFAVPPSPEMIAQSEIGMPDARRDDAAQAAPPKHWSASCLVHRACPTKEQALPVCEPGRTAPFWSDVQRDAASLLGKTIDVKGGLGLAPTQATSASKCAPDTCCHSLRMGVTLDGSPIALPLVGLTCAGDDSKLCCNAPANGQMAIAHGRLAKAPGNGVAKWQLENVTLCEPEVPPTPDH